MQRTLFPAGYAQSCDGASEKQQAARYRSCLMPQSDFQHGRVPLLGRGGIKPGRWASPCPGAPGVQSLPPFKIQYTHSTLLSPRGLPHLCTCQCWSRDEQSQARSLCPCFTPTPALWCGQSPGSSCCGQGRNITASCCVPHAAGGQSRELPRVLCKTYSSANDPKVAKKCPRVPLAGTWLHPQS